MVIPLQAKLKRETHRKTAYAQDIIVRAVYARIGTAVLHGGTAIWRCYQGKRFSEDLDFYFPSGRKAIDEIFNDLKQAGFEIRKKKISERSVYSELELNRTVVRLEATFQNKKGIICDFELSDGNYIPIYSLSEEEFLREKALTYLKRRKVRDLWDVFFLVGRIGKTDSEEVGQLIAHFEPPTDEKDLKTILLEGIIPSASQMLEYIKRKWAGKST